MDEIGGCLGTILVMILVAVAGAYALAFAGVLIVTVIIYSLPVLAGILAASITVMVTKSKLSQNLRLDDEPVRLVFRDGRVAFNEHDLPSRARFSPIFRTGAIVGCIAGFIVIRLLYPHLHPAASSPLVTVIVLGLIVLAARSASRMAREQMETRTSEALTSRIGSLQELVNDVRGQENKLRYHTPLPAALPIDIDKELQMLIEGHTHHSVDELRDDLQQLHRKVLEIKEEVRSAATFREKALAFGHSARLYAQGRSMLAVLEIERIMATLSHPDTLELLTSRQWAKFNKLVVDAITRIELVDPTNPHRRSAHTNYQAPPPPAAEPQQSRVEWAHTIFGLKAGATPAEIKTRYRELAGALHPDKVATKGDGARERFKRLFQELQEAYEILTQHSAPA